MTDYHINIFYSDKNGGYIADIPWPGDSRAALTRPTEALRVPEPARAA